MKAIAVVYLVSWLKFSNSRSIWRFTNFRLGRSSSFSSIRFGSRGSRVSVALGLEVEAAVSSIRFEVGLSVAVALGLECRDLAAAVSVALGLDELEGLETKICVSLVSNF